MAVIQDLPREILRRILELGAGDPTCLKGRDLYSTALVARAWSQPSQELLVSLWWIPYLPKAPQYDTSPPPTRRLLFVTVYSPTTTAQIRRLVDRHGTQLTHLDMCGLSEASDLIFFLVNGLEHLDLAGMVHGDFAFPDRTDLTLSSLYLNSLSRLPARFLQDLVARAPHLTRLQLQSSSAFAAIHRAPLPALAPQLRHLTLSVTLARPADSDLDSCALLRTCTSLVSLDFPLLTPGLLPTLLSSIPSHLVILACHFDGYVSTDESVCSDLLGALEQPAMSNLMRWRWMYRCLWKSGAQDSYSGETVKSWEAACRARGIEPRGEGRYYTD